MMLSLIFKSSSIMELTFLCVVFLTGLFQVDGIMFHLQPNSRKCLREELQAHVVMIGEYEVSEAYGQKVDYVVKDSKGQILTQKADITKGKFTFATETFETCEICFTSKVPPHQQGVIQEVMLITKRGAEAKIYDNYADATKLKPMEAELKRLEDLSEEIVKDFSLMRKNEEDMRNTNESTNRRVLHFTIFSMVCLLGLATWQVFYLRSYFKSKKLIG